MTRNNETSFSVDATKDMIKLMNEIFKSVQESINPTKSIKRRRILRSVHFDISEYIPPTRTFDIKRLWKRLVLKKSKNCQKRTIKLNPLKGFRDPLKLERRYYLNMPSCTAKPFLLKEEDYIPPAEEIPPHIASADRVTMFINPGAEKAVLGRYKGPVTKVKSKAIKIIDYPELICGDMYHAPPGSKENYTCKKYMEFSDTDKALEEVSILLRYSPHKNYEILGDTKPADCFLGKSDDFEYTTQRTKNVNLNLTESENEEDVLNGVAINDKALLCGDTGVMQKLDSCEIWSAVMLDVVGVNKDKPVSVKRTVKASSSVSKWIEENIVHISQNELEFYRPPSCHEIDMSSAFTKSSSSLLTKSNTHLHSALENRSKSCFSFGTSSNETIAPKELSSELENKMEIPSSVKQEKLHNTSPTNSAEEILELKQQDPAKFYVLRSLCCKQLTNYQCEKKRETMPRSKFRKQTKCHSSWWNKKQAARKIRSLAEEMDHGYLGSEEDEEYKASITSDYWPIPSQHTKPSSASASCKNSECSDTETILIDHTDHWSMISEYEELFSQFHHKDFHYVNDCMLILPGKNDDAEVGTKKSKVSAQSCEPTKVNGLKECFIKLCSLFKYAFLKNL